MSFVVRAIATGLILKWKSDLNRGQLLPVVLLLENLNIRHFLTPGLMFCSSDMELKGKAVQHRHIIRNYLGVSVTERMSCVAIAQTLLGKLRLSLTYVGRFGARGEWERVYQFIEPKEKRDVIYSRYRVVGVHQ
jgi:hypothetical protein